MSRKIHWKKGDSKGRPDVNPSDLQLVMRKGLLIVDKEFERLGFELTITCTGDGDHSPTSLHPWGFAFDCRTRMLSAQQKNVLYDMIEAEFKNTPFQIVEHSTHFHIEYDPKDWKETF